MEWYRARSTGLSLESRRGWGWLTWKPRALGAVVAFSGCFSPRSPAPVEPSADAATDDSPGPVDAAPDPIGDALGPVDVAPSAAGYAAVVLADQPSGYWRLGDMVGPTAVDASGHEQAGTYGSGVTLGMAGAIASDADTAAAFDNQAAVSLPDHNFEFLGSAAFSIEAWIKPTRVDEVHRHVFTKQHRGTPKEGYALLVQEAKGISFERFVDDEPALIVVPTLWDTRFTYVVATYDGAFMRLYVNGQKAGEEPDSRGQLAIMGAPAVIGAADPTESFFVGLIDEVAVYPRALSSEHIQMHYAAGTMP